MTKRDYANRTPKKPTRGKPRGKTQQATPRRPILLGLLVLAALASFGYFLWAISGSSENSQQQATKAEKAKATQVKPSKAEPKALPPKPKEEWSYLEELQNKQVEVDIPKVETKPKRPYQMQCGSFRRQAQANEMKAVIAFQGLEAQVRKTQGSKGTWYKVVLGPYDRKRDAERHRHALQKAGMNGCQIWYWTSS